jgi:hypothetical protein
MKSMLPGPWQAKIVLLTAAVCAFGSGEAAATATADSAKAVVARARSTR